MTTKDIASLRLYVQQVVASRFKTAKEVVSYMGALQAQEYPMSKWAVGIRLPGSTERTVQAAVDKGELLRTHVMRPTWHLVSPDDIYWMLELTGPRIQQSLKTWQQHLELSGPVLKKAMPLLERALRDHNHHTREELHAVFNKAKIATNENRLAHILMWAETERIICSGAYKAGKQTYALLAERTPKLIKQSREESLGMLALRYFSSHGPATAHDFSWWSGLSLTDSRRGLEMNKSTLVSTIVGTQTYWMKDIPIPGKPKVASYILPAYDEYLISYKDRTASLREEHNKSAISVNGIFKPTVVVNGQVVGLWKRTMVKNALTVDVSLYHKISEAAKKEIAKAIKAYGSFVENKANATIGIG